MPYAKINEIDLFYSIHGCGPASLVLHGGLGLDHAYLRPWLDPLGELEQLVYYDHRHNGRSDRSSIDLLNMDQLCADADALREHVQAEQIGLIAHSFGGFIALEYALRHPERVRHLILIATSAKWDFGSAQMLQRIQEKGLTPDMEAMLSTLPGTDRELEEYFSVLAPLYYHKPLETPASSERVIYNVEAALRGIALSADWDFREKLSRIKAPTLIISGGDDPFFPPQAAEFLLAGIQSSQLRIFKQSGHYPFAEEPERFLETAGSWIQGLSQHQTCTA